MQDWAAIAVFCEDIREEKSGTDTLVGVLHDNLVVSSIPGLMPKLGVYVRIQLPKDGNTKRVSTRIRTSQADNIAPATLDHLVDQATQDARAKELPYAGLVSKAVVSPFPIQSVGAIEAVIRVDDSERVCGILNIQIGD